MTTLARSSTSGSAKARWSACYALGVMLAEAEAHQGALPAPWSTPVFGSLQVRVAVAPSKMHAMLCGDVLHIELGQRVPTEASPTVSFRLCSCMQECLLRSENHKVRIAAAQALMALTHRKSYGSFFAPVFKSYVTALHDVDDVKDFSNYKYKQTLRAQVRVLRRLPRATVVTTRAHTWPAPHNRCPRRFCVPCRCVAVATSGPSGTSSSNTRSSSTTGC